LLAVQFVRVGSSTRDVRQRASTTVRRLGVLIIASFSFLLYVVCCPLRVSMPHLFLGLVRLVKSTKNALGSRFLTRFYSPPPQVRRVSWQGRPDGGALLLVEYSPLLAGRRVRRVSWRGRMFQTAAVAHLRSAPLLGSCSLLLGPRRVRRVSWRGRRPAFHPGASRERAAR